MRPGSPVAGGWTQWDDNLAKNCRKLDVPVADGYHMIQVYMGDTPLSYIMYIYIYIYIYILYIYYIYIHPVHNCWLFLVAFSMKCLIAILVFLCHHPEKLKWLVIIDYTSRTQCVASFWLRPHLVCWSWKLRIWSPVTSQHPRRHHDQSRRVGTPRSRSR